MQTSKIELSHAWRCCRQVIILEGFPCIADTFADNHFSQNCFHPLVDQHQSQTVLVSLGRESARHSQCVTPGLWEVVAMLSKMCDFGVAVVAACDWPGWMCVLHSQRMITWRIHCNLSETATQIKRQCEERTQRCSSQVRIEPWKAALCCTVWHL